MLPYEAELGRSPSLEDLLTFVLEKRLRPTVPHLWARISQVQYTAIFMHGKVRHIQNLVTQPLKSVF